MECIWMTTEFVEILNEQLTKVFYLVRVKHFVFSAMKITQPIFEINWRMICWRLFTVIPSFTLCAPSLCWTIWVVQKSVVIKLTRVFTVAWFVFLSIFYFWKWFQFFLERKTTNKFKTHLKRFINWIWQGLKLYIILYYVWSWLFCSGKFIKWMRFLHFFYFYFFWEILFEKN